MGGTVPRRMTDPGGPLAGAEYATEDNLRPRDPRPHRVRVVPGELLPGVPPGSDREHDERRIEKRTGRPVYWAGIDWREILDLQGAGKAIEPQDQKKTDACAGFAVAHALRANAAIVGRSFRRFPNPYFLWGVARARAMRFWPSHTNLLLGALHAANNYRVPVDSRPTAREAAVGTFKSLEELAMEFRDKGRRGDKASPYKLQSIVDLGCFLGDWAAWLHAHGPIVVNMTVDRERYDAVTPQNPVLRGYRAGQAHDGALTTAYGGHDVVVVGYLPSEARKYRDSFVIMNSYGKRWGDGGFAYVPVDQARLMFRFGYGLLFREHLGYGHDGNAQAPKLSRLAPPPRPDREAPARRSRR